MALERGGSGGGKVVSNAPNKQVLTASSAQKAAAAAAAAARARSGGGQTVQNAVAKKVIAPTSPAVRAKAAAPAPAPRQTVYSAAPQSFDMGGGGGGGVAAPVAPAPDPAEVARQAAARAAVDYQVDPEYLAAKGAYDNVYDQLMATITRENSVYDQDLVKAHDNMGWRGADKGGWDFQNIDTAAGRGMKNLTDDYAARGMLRGSGFGEAQNSFQTSLQKQLDQLTAQQNEFKGGQTEKLTQADTSRKQSVNMAAAQALARLTQLYTGA